jgi:hypothetical protein
MDYFKELALNSALHKPAMWLRHVDETFVVWSHGMKKLQESFFTKTVLDLPCKLP